MTLAGGADTLVVIKNWGYIDVDYIEIVPTGTPTWHENTSRHIRFSSLT